MDRLRSIHDELLNSVAADKDRLGALELTTFFPIRGLTATGELMIVGRAVNGWIDTDPWSAAELEDPSRRTRIIDAVVKKATAKGEHCPMSWVKKMWGAPSGEYNTRKSAYWRLIRAVSQSIMGDSENWASRLIWSNLYKVAPFNGGNPSDRLCAAQESACLRHLKAEVELWKPKRLLFITDWNWASPFVEHLGSAIGEPMNGCVKWAGTVEGARGTLPVRVVVSVRPERRPEAKLAELILQSFA